MASRAKRINSWDEPLASVARAKRLTERFGLHEAHPDDYLDRLSDKEAKDWDDLLKKI